MEGTPQALHHVPGAHAGAAAGAVDGKQDGSHSPDLSFGAHFFHDLIETRIFYLAIYSEYTGVVFNDKWFRALPNQLASISPLDSRLGHVVNVGDTCKLGLMLHANSLQQRVICYLGNAPGKNNPSPQT